MSHVISSLLIQVSVLQFVDLIDCWFSFVDRRTWNFGNSETTLRIKSEFSLAAISDDLFPGPTLLRG